MSFYDPLKLNKAYVSEIDLFLAKLNHHLPLSQSQEEEIAQARQVQSLRDDPKARKREEII